MLNSNPLSGFIQTELQAAAIPACSLVVVDRSGIISTGAFGYADLQQRRLATPETAYHLFSGTKLYTATAVMQLVEAGKLSRDDCLGKHIPGLGRVEHITIKQLLTHSCTQAEALVLAAEARLGLRSWRRTDLLRQRLHTFEQQMALTRQHQELQAQAVQQAQDRLAKAEQQQQARQQHLTELEQTYQARQRRECPTSQLAQARQRLHASARRCHSRQQAWQTAQWRWAKTTAPVAATTRSVERSVPTPDPL